MRALFSMALVAAGTILWFTAWGWVSTLVVVLGMNLFIFLIRKAKEGSKVFFLAGIATLLLMLVFYAGAPVAAWLVWGQVQGIAYGIISTVGLFTIVRDVVTSKQQPESIDR